MYLVAFVHSTARCVATSGFNGTWWSYGEHNQFTRYEGAILHVEGFCRFWCQLSWLNRFVLQWNNFGGNYLVPLSQSYLVSYYAGFILLLFTTSPIAKMGNELKSYKCKQPHFAFRCVIVHWFWVTVEEVDDDNQNAIKNLRTRMFVLFLLQRGLVVNCNE